MKRFMLFAVVAVMMTFVARGAFAQYSGPVYATAETFAEIVSGVTIMNAPNSSLNFGVIYQPTAGSVQATVNPENGLTNGTAKWADRMRAHPAEFKIIGPGGYSVRVNLPRDSYVLDGPGGATMMVYDFKSYPNSPSPDVGAQVFLDATGEGTIKVGATLEVNNAQAIGQYYNPDALRIQINF